MNAETVVLLAIGGGITLYALLGGADFGAGVWQAIAGRRAGPEEREQVHAAVGPVWEANHVWLVFVLVVTFTAFPPALAALARALWVPLLLALLGIVLRGAGFAFRPRDPARRREARAWEVLFAGASVAAPFFLGAALGAVAEGRLEVAADGGFSGSVFAWVSPLSLFTGAFGVGICAHLAAVFLARESAFARRAELLTVWRRRSLLSGIVVGAAAMAGIAVLSFGAPALWERFRDRGLVFVALSAAGGVGALLAVVYRRYTLAVVGAGASVASVLWGWFAAQVPYLVLPTITVESARAPEAVLVAVAWSVVVGAALVLPSLLVLFRVFKSERAVRLEESAGGDQGIGAAQE